MLSRLPIPSIFAPFRLLLAALSISAASDACAQVLTIPQMPYGDYRAPEIPDKIPDKPSLPLAFSIPVAPLGFTAPRAVYLFHHASLVSLDFLDENRLLFTFPSPGLLERQSRNDASVTERKIHAVVLTLPDGKVQSEASWILPDWARYLWMLNDGHFLLRNLRDGLDLGDASLKTAPYLHFPGQLLWLEMDPAQKLIVTNWLESATPPQPPATPPAAGAAPKSDATLVVRTQQRESGQLLSVTRVPFTSQSKDWAMNSQGYLVKSHDSDGRWLLTLQFFAGDSRPFGHVDSGCPPDYSFISDTELLVIVCDPPGGQKIEALSANGDLLWQGKNSPNAYWPLLIMAPNGLRAAQETLLLKRPADKYKRNLSARDFLGQVVRVFDAATGNIVLEAPIAPMLDGGGNVAISPSGRRVAILTGGVIEVFSLPAPAQFPAAPSPSAH
jgi:hypothetical protein